jgi:hypothetical protein
VLTYVFGIIIAAGALAAVGCLAAAGFRNGDRPGDARVTALIETGLHRSRQPAAPRRAAGSPATREYPTGPIRAGPRPAAVRPDEPGPVIIATVCNPSGAPVLAALRVRRSLVPLWFALPLSVGVPRRTTGRRYRPARYATVGVVPPGDTGRLTVPAPRPARRCLLIVAVGQEGSRLRVHRLRLGAAGDTADGRDAFRPSCLLP